MKAVRIFTEKYDTNYFRIPFPKLSDVIGGIRKSDIIVIGGQEGDGKSSFVDNLVLNELNSDYNYLIHYLGYKDRLKLRLNKFVARRIFEKKKSLYTAYDVENFPLEGKDWVEIQNSLDNVIIEEINEAKAVESYLNKLDENIHNIVIIDEIDNLNFVDDETYSSFLRNIKYKVNKSNISMIIVKNFDYGLKLEAKLQKHNYNELRPTLQDFGFNSLRNYATLLIALFNPHRYKITESFQYNVSRLKDRYRSMYILKSNYSRISVNLGLAFLGEIGKLEELPTEMTELYYNKLTSIK